MTTLRRIIIVAAVVTAVGATAWWLRGPRPGAHATAGAGKRAAPAWSASSGSARATPPAFVAAGHGVGSAPAPDTAEARAQALCARLLALLLPGGALPDGAESELSSITSELAGLGDAGARALIERLDQGNPPAAARDRLFDVLRGLPGNTAEARLAEEARRGKQDGLRTMAIEALAERKTDRAFATLAAVARTDPNMPAKSLIAEARDPNDPSTELPDEQVFTPRMQAMAALAGTKDPRAAEVLADIVNGGPDEALRMEAARHLAGFRDHPRTLAALRAAAAGDASPYVRLAALHSLSGANDSALSPVLEHIAARDRDAGVRLLAQQVLTTLRK